MRNPAKSRAQVFIYLIFNFSVRVRVIGLGLGLIIPTCRVNLVLRVFWQCDIFGMTPALVHLGSDQIQHVEQPFMLIVRGNALSTLIGMMLMLSRV